MSQIDVRIQCLYRIHSDDTYLPGDTSENKASIKMCRWTHSMSIPGKITLQIRTPDPPPDMTNHKLFVNASS